MSRTQTPALNPRRPPINNPSLKLTSFAPSTSHQAISRTATPSSSRNVISLEEWESKAQLSDAQLQSISFVRDTFGERPLPDKVRLQPIHVGFCASASLPVPASVVKELITRRSQFTQAESSVQASSRPGSPPAPRPRQFAHLMNTPPMHSRPPSKPGSPAPTSQLAVPDSIYPSSIVTPQQFHEHFTALTLLTEHEQDSLYRDHLGEISGLREKCDGLIGLLRGGEAEVGDMLKALEYVEERSESLRGACEDLLEEQASPRRIKRDEG